MFAFLRRRRPPTSSLPVRARNPLPEPLRLAASYFRRDGRRGVVIDDRTGRVWLLEPDPERRTAAARATPITVPRRPEGDGWLVHDLSGSDALDRLLLWTDQPRVYALPSGQAVAELALPLDGRALCLTPDGRQAICLDEDRAWIRDLDAPVRPWTEVWDLHVIETEDGGGLEALFLDHVDAVAAVPCGPPREAMSGEDPWFRIAAACYGFVATHQAESWPGRVYREPGASRVVGGLVYDPTALVAPFGGHVWVLHGYGAGLAAIAPATGARHDCDIRGPRQQGYGFFHRVVPCGEAPMAWVRCRDGEFLWRVGAEPVRMPDAPGTVLAVYPGALLCIAPDAGELLWCDLPAADPA